MAEVRSIDEIVAEIRGVNKPTKYVAPSSGAKMFAPDTTRIQDIEYNIPTSAIYDKLSDGSFIAKYENYKGAEGNEDRLAKQQSWYEQAGYGLLKNVRKAGNYALDATVGTAYGLYKGISEGSMSAAWDNDFSNMLDDWNKKLDNKLPNYYTDEEKSNGLLAAIPGFGATNFWFNDVTGGLAFVAGAVLPEIAIGALSGGTTLGGSLAKLGFKSAIGATTKAGKVIDKAADAIKFSQGRDVLRGGYRALAGQKVGDVIHTADFLIRSSGFEAGMEARHNFKDAVSTYMETFEEKNGRPPSTEELSNFTGQARKAANSVFAANMSILSVSNAAMYGKVFNLKTPTITNSLKNKANKVIGLGTETKIVEEAGQKVLKTSIIESTKAQRALGKVYKTLGKPAMEGIYEEGLQGVAGKTMQNYLEAKYDPTSDAGYGMMASLTDAFANQYGTSEGWKEMGIGMLIGFAGGAVQPGGIKSGQAFSGFGKNSYKTAEKELQENVKIVNDGITELRSMNRASSIRNFRNIADGKADNYQSTSAENTMANFEFIKSQEHMKSASEVNKDFETIIDNIQLEQEEMNELESRGMSIEDYKTSLKEEFKSDIDAYNFAKDVTSALGLDQRVKGTPGTLSEIKDAVAMSIMLGKNSEKNAKNVANQIGQVIGIDGMFDYMEHYNQLTTDNKLKVEELVSKKQQLKDAEETAKELGLKIASLPKGSQADNKLKKAYQKEAEKLVVAQNTVQRLAKETKQLSDSLSNDLRVSTMNVNQSSLMDNINISIDEVVDNLNKLEVYTNSLKAAGKDVEADSIEYLIGQFKFYSEANKEMTNLARRMRDTNFFSSKEGKNMISSITGEKYKIDPEFEQAIKDNDEYIKRSIASFLNISESEVDSYESIRNSIQDNPNLSEREKFRLSSILRVQLGLQSVYDKAAELQKVMITTDKDEAKSPLDGDTVSLRQAQEIKDRNIDNIEALNQTIEEITKELDFLVTKSARNEDTIEALRKEREELIKRVEEGAEVVLTQQEREDLISKLEEEFGVEIMDNIDNTVDLKTEKLTGTPQEVAIKRADIKQQLNDAGITIRGDKKTLVKLKDTTTEANRISEIDEKLKSLEGSFKIIDSEEYIRLNELYKKQENIGLSAAEKDELAELEQDINQWLLVTGTIAGGLRLSDLIRQKVSLEEMEVLPLENVETVTSKDVLDDVQFSDRSQSNHYDITQTYDSVTATLDPKTNLVEVAGISAVDLAIEIGDEFKFKVSTKGTNTILISQDEVRRINETGKVKILPTNKNLDTNYSVVTTLVTDINGEQRRVPLKGGFQNEFTQFQNIDAVFSAQVGDDLFVEIDANDAWNKALLDDYQKSVGVPNITEEQEEELVEARYQDKVSKDKTIQAKLVEVVKIEEELKSPTLNQKEIDKRKKKLTTLSNQILRIEDKLRDKAQKEVDKLKGTTTNEKEIADQLDYIARTIVIKVKDKDGNFLSVFKGIRYEGGKGITGEQFEALRYQIAMETDLIPRLAATRGMEKVEVNGLKVKKVFMGHPNYNFVDNADGSISIEHRRVDAQQAKKVVDIGYVQNGKVRSKSQVKGVDMTFLSKFEKSKGASKVPFIVLEIGNKRVAYPVQTTTQQKEPLDEFSKIFNSNTEQTTKAIALNKFMAARGIDVTQTGNAFLVAGENSNLNDKFFNDKLAQLESIDYFYSLDNWISATADIQNIVENQVLVDINLITPFHSPKLQMDLSNVEIDPKFRKNTTEAEDDQVSVKDAKTENEAKENINEPC